MLTDDVFGWATNNNIWEGSTHISIPRTLFSNIALKLNFLLVAAKFEKLILATEYVAGYVSFLPVGPAPEFVGGRVVRVELDGPRAVPDAGVWLLHLDVAVAPLREHSRRSRVDLDGLREQLRGLLPLALAQRRHGLAPLGVEGVRVGLGELRLGRVAHVLRGVVVRLCKMGV